MMRWTRKFPPTERGGGWPFPPQGMFKEAFRPFLFLVFMHVFDRGIGVGPRQWWDMALTRTVGDEGHLASDLCRV